MKELKPLETTRLILNTISLADEKAIFDLFSNDQVLEFYDVRKFTSSVQARQLITQIGEKFENETGFRYAIRLKPLKQDEPMIGSFGVNRILNVAGQFGAVIGCDLHPDYWQKGYMSEVLTVILSELKNHQLFSKKISFVVAEVYVGNDGSMQLLRKHGFHQVSDNIAEQIRLDLEISSRQIFKLALN